MKMCLTKFSVPLLPITHIELKRRFNGKLEFFDGEPTQTPWSIQYSDLLTGQGDGH